MLSKNLLGAFKYFYQKNKHDAKYVKFSVVYFFRILHVKIFAQL